MEDFETPLSNLLCNENESCLQEQNNQKEENFELYPVSESDCDYIENLIQRETSFKASGTECSVKEKRSWFKCARLDAIKWILDAKGLFGFHLSTAYLSMIYFDRFFSRRWIDDEKLWAIRLLSVASLSLAAKMEECEVPGLSEYHVDEYNFEGNVIQKMELLVLNTLEWRMSYATPFVYLNYFTAKFCEEFRHKELVTRATDLILAVMEEIDVSEDRPSVVAAAAVLAAYDNQLTKKLFEMKINAIPSWGYLEKEHTFSCYSLLQQIAMFKSKTPISNISRNSLSTNSSSIDVLDDDKTIGIGTKRRLTYTNGDPHCPLHKGAPFSRVQEKSRVVTTKQIVKGGIWINKEKHTFSLEVMSKKLSKVGNKKPVVEGVRAKEMSKGSIKACGRSFLVVVFGLMNAFSAYHFFEKLIVYS